MLGLAGAPAALAQPAHLCTHGPPRARQPLEGLFPAPPAPGPPRRPRGGDGRRHSRRENGAGRKHRPTSFLVVFGASLRLSLRSGRDEAGQGQPRGQPPSPRVDFAASIFHAHSREGTVGPAGRSQRERPAAPEGLIVQAQGLAHKARAAGQASRPGAIYLKPRAEFTRRAFSDRQVARRQAKSIIQCRAQRLEADAQRTAAPSLHLVAQQTPTLADSHHSARSPRVAPSAGGRRHRLTAIAG